LDKWVGRRSCARTQRSAKLLNTSVDDDRPARRAVRVRFRPEGELVVEVHQVVLDLNGNLLADQMVGRVFRIENGLIERFDIRGV
jgi:hypothetical protein